MTPLSNFFNPPLAPKSLHTYATTYENFIKIDKTFTTTKNICDAFVKLESENLHNFIN